MHYKQNNKESKSYVQGLRQFGNTLPRGIKGILKKNGYNYSEIIGKWKDLVGDKNAKISHPKSIKMKKGENNGILVLNIKRGDEIDVEYSKNEIMDKINSYFGFRLISGIKTEVTNSNIKNIKNKKILIKHTNNLEKKIKEINNEKIKNSLLKFIETLKK